MASRHWSALAVSEDLVNRSVQRFDQELHSIRSQMKPIMYSLNVETVDSSSDPLFCCRARMCLLNSSEYLTVEIVLDTQTLRAMDDQGLKCEVPIIEIDHVSIDEFVQICFIHLKSDIKFTLLCFEDVSLSDFLTALEHSIRLKSRSQCQIFRPFISSLSISSGATKMVWFCALDAVVIESTSVAKETLEDDLIFAEFLERSKGRDGKATKGHFLLKEGTLYLTNGPKHSWVLNEPKLSPVISTSNEDAMLKPNALALLFPKSTLTLTFSCIKERKVWNQALAAAIEYKESHLLHIRDAQRIDSVCVGIDEMHGLNLFKVLPNRFAERNLIPISTVLDVVSMSTKVVKLNLKSGGLWFLHFRTSTESAEFKQRLVKSL